MDAARVAELRALYDAPLTGGAYTDEHLVTMMMSMPEFLDEAERRLEAEAMMGDLDNYRRDYAADGVPCEVEGCQISQQEHHRLAYGWILELRELRRKVEEHNRAFPG